MIKPTCKNANNQQQQQQSSTTHLSNLQILENLSAFMYKIEKSYQKVPYHNHYHAVDVLVAVEVLMNQVEDTSLAKFTAFERFSCLLAAACHDVGHPAVNSIHISDVAAKIYCAENLDNFSLDAEKNSKNGLLERYHCKIALSFMSDFKFKILHSLEFLNLFDNLIMATDMTHHKKLIDQLEELIQVLEKNGTNDPTNQLQSEIMETNHQRQTANATVSKEDSFYTAIEEFSSNELNSIFDGEQRQKLLGIILHLADLSNPAKLFKDSSSWARRVFLREGKRCRLSIKKT